MSTRKKPASRGFVNNIILECLLTGDKYGYEIIKEVEDKSSGKVVLKQSSLYSSLKRFEAKGFITSYWGESDKGGRRNYYTITELGKNYFNENVSDASLLNLETKTNPAQIKTEQLEIETPYSTANDIDDKDIVKKDDIKTDIKDVTNEDAIEEGIKNDNQLQNSEQNLQDITAQVNVEVENKNATEIINVVQDVVSDVQDVTHSVQVLADEENNATTLLDLNDEKNLDTSNKNEFEKVAQFDANQNDTTNTTDTEADSDINSAKILNEVINQETKDTNDSIVGLEFGVENNNNLNFDNGLTKDDNYDIFDVLESNENIETLNQISNNESSKSAPSSIQVEMFDDNNNKNELNVRQSVDVTKINKVKQSDDTSVVQVGKDRPNIPLIQEQQSNFHSWDDLKRIQTTPIQTHDDKPEATKKPIILDEFGILKTDENLKTTKQSKTFDNVGVRINYKDPVMKQVHEGIVIEEEEDSVSDEEREIKKEQFNKKFDEIATSSFNRRSDSSSVDYKSLLGDLLATDEEVAEATNAASLEIVNSNVNMPTTQTNINEYQSASVAFSDAGFKFKPYVITDKNQQKQSIYLLANKARMRTGIFMFFLMLLQTLALFLILRSYGYIYSTDYILYGVACGVAILVLVFSIIPYLITPQYRVENNFKLSYSLLFGILLFLATLAVTYALNTFMGMNNSNIILFASKLLLPTVIASNFIFAPLVKAVVLTDKKLY